MLFILRQYLDYMTSNVRMTDEVDEFRRKRLWSNRGTVLKFAWGD
jgi:hypothetical protein